MIPVYVIHLPNAERKAKIAAELARVGFCETTYVYAREPYQGFTASNYRRNARGEFGCALSHLKAIMLAVSNREEEALFIEDDIVFNGAPDPLRFPMDWDIVYLGGHPRGPVTLDEGFARISGGFSCAEAYVMHHGSMCDFLQFWCDRAGQKNGMIDIVLGEFAAQSGGYAFYPPITHQPPAIPYTIPDPRKESPARLLAAS